MIFVLDKITLARSVTIGFQRFEQLVEIVMSTVGNRRKSNIMSY